MSKASSRYCNYSSNWRSSKKMIFGSRHERYVPHDNPSQLTLDITADAVATCSVTDVQKISYIRSKVNVEVAPIAHPGRMKLPGHLRREEIIIEPAVDITDCKKIGDEITEVLEYTPGELYVKQYRRAKYAKKDNSAVMIGELPSRPLDKAMAGEGLLAQIIIDKYVDHLPLYRQMQRFERAGVKLSYSTLTDWVSGTCNLITPLFEALKAEVLQSNYLHADETPIKVMDKDKKGETHRGYYWVYQNSIDKTVLFDYHEGRGREGPTGILKDFTGYLQTDGYVGYEVFAKRPGITLIHCMAHARRMFHDAVDNNSELAAYALQQMQVLYAIERKCRAQSLGFAEIREVRQRESLPILQSLGRMDERTVCESAAEKCNWKSARLQYRTLRQVI
ncbi:MAG: IS66 family transposase [Chitinophagaceae bacterium]|nr:IS66 family transposase [Chitinophagaceae bacterium]